MLAKTLAPVKLHWFIALVVLAAGLLTVLIAGLIPGLSALLAAIILGAVIGNARVLPRSVNPGISWASKKFLRLGIVLLGFKLSLISLLEIGGAGIVILIVTVIVTFAGTVAIGKLIGVSRVSRMLVATGFAICGASAVAAMSSIVDPDGEAEEDVAQAIALVTIFGTVTMFAIPALVPILGLDDVQAGIWIGASVHEVAQVVAAGGMVSAAALAFATLAKLGRVVLLAPLIAIVGAVESRRSERQAGTRPPVLPLFVAGFLAAVVLRTFVAFPPDVLSILESGSNILLTAAMLGLGFAVDIRRLIATGWRPVILGALSTLLAASTALVCIFALLG